MSHRLLVLNSTARGADSVSAILVEEIVARHLARDPSIVITERNLDAAPLPHLTASSVNGVRGQAVTDAELAARQVSDELIAELKAADTLVIGAPMHNFSVPTTLRAWFDYVLRPRVTFSYSAAGPQGLMSGKKAILALARGGVYTEGPAVGLDFQEPYLRQLLAFIGITDVEVVHAERIGSGAEARAASIATARDRIASVVDRRLAA